MVFKIYYQIFIFSIKRKKKKKICKQNQKSWSWVPQKKYLFWSISEVIPNNFKQIKNKSRQLKGLKILFTVYSIFKKLIHKISLLRLDHCPSKML